MTDSKHAAPATSNDAAARVLAAAPISWGVCEVPGWGLQLPAERVLAEMRSLGFQATEAGAEGYLPDDGDALASLLGEHGLGLVGGFVPVVLHEQAARDGTMARVRAQAERFARGGGSVLISALVVDEAWSPRTQLDADDWRRVFDGFDRVDEICADAGLAHGLHPHAGTLVETADDVARVVDGSGVRLCLDTGHFAIGGVDSAALVRETPRRVIHVHLKDVREDVAEDLRAGRASLRDATARGLFVPLGDGDAPVADVLGALDASGYEGWYVLEQDAVIDGSVDAPAPAENVRRSIDFMRTPVAGPGLAARGFGGR